MKEVIIKLKFIFPQNYDLNTKIFGIIDYSAAIVDVAWGAIVFFLIKLLLKRLTYKIFAFIILVFPVVIFSIVGVEGENLLYFLAYIIKYIFKQKLYLYEKKWKKCQYLIIKYINLKQMKVEIWKKKLYNADNILKDW